LRVIGTSFRAQHDRRLARLVNERQAQTSDTVKKNRSAVSVPLMVGGRAWASGAMTSALGPRGMLILDLLLLMRRVLAMMFAVASVTASAQSGPPATNSPSLTETLQWLNGASEAESGDGDEHHTFENDGKDCVEIDLSYSFAQQQLVAWMQRQPQRLQRRYPAITLWSRIMN
jgi:hypothetical protein